MEDELSEECPEKRPYGFPADSETYSGGGEEGTSMVKVGPTRTSIFANRRNEKRKKKQRKKEKSWRKYEVFCFWVGRFRLRNFRDEIKAMKKRIQEYIYCVCVRERKRRRRQREREKGDKRRRGNGTKDTGLFDTFIETGPSSYQKFIILLI